METNLEIKYLNEIDEFIVTSNGQHVKEIIKEIKVRLSLSRLMVGNLKQVYQQIKRLILNQSNIINM